jgi:hypothetical protein
MKRKQPFNKIELWLQSIPTWCFVTGVVAFLSLIALWVSPDRNPKSFRDVVQVIFGSAESIAIAAAVALYFKEIPDRKEQKHYEAWQVIDNAAAANVPTSYARRKAMENLLRDRVSLRGVDMPEADLESINLSEADLRESDLERANLIYANLSGAKLSGANLLYANLSGANLEGADLNGANLEWAILRGARLSRADLFMANLSCIQWDDNTQWPEPAEVAKAKNIPEALKRHLGIQDSPPPPTT